ncbi:F-box/kelch-repeat protein [Pyrus ussuriensis x Pyrus communis]|uniref:F-box/kelch-repeat protein n=1 Tax=Pyrus ussuriensis x Pyrus communis TaxID=2448454 RepID=A0A5N5GLR9_9ROSA|nr:F-box/kelch-repeat protein [Pyrus ussuriensis x Pyrus communis]
MLGTWVASSGCGKVKTWIWVSSPGRRFTLCGQTVFLLPGCLILPDFLHRPCRSRQNLQRPSRGLLQPVERKKLLGHVLLAYLLMGLLC